MRRFARTMAAVASVAALAVTPAFASGGGGSGGGGGGGGIDATQTTGPCIKLTNVTDPVGYYLTWAAVWHNFTVKSCSLSTQTVNLTVTDTNTATGQAEFSETFSYYLVASDRASSVIDNDFAPFSVDYAITTTVTDASSGAVLASATVNATTPPQK